MVRRVSHWILLLATIAAGAAGSACGSSTSAAAPGGGGGGVAGADAAATAARRRSSRPRSPRKTCRSIWPRSATSRRTTTISIRSQVTGLLTDSFHEGDFVKQGQQLFTIDRASIQAALAQAEANLERDKALLAQAEAQFERDAANAEYQQLSAERKAQLGERGIVSKDQAEQTRRRPTPPRRSVKADRAAIESARAELVAQEAAVANAGWRSATRSSSSPINGQTGKLSVKVGNLVTANQTELTTIAQVEPVYVTFSVPAVHLPTIKSHMKEHELEVMATPQDTEGEPASGVLSFIDNAVDMTTDTIKLKASFANAERRSGPASSCASRCVWRRCPRATVVPAQAVQTGQDGQFVFVVKDDSTVEQRPGRAGPARRR